MARRSLTRHPHPRRRTVSFDEPRVDTALMAHAILFANIRIIQIVNSMRVVHVLVAHDALVQVGRSSGA